MAGCISLGGQFLFVSNTRLSALVAFALEVGAEQARTDVQRGSVTTLRAFEENAWPGIDFDLDERFPGLDEKKFWAAVFGEVARRIFLRQLGDQSVTVWQPSAIGDAHVVSRMLTRAVQEIEIGWHPGVDEGDGAGAQHGQVNVTL